MRVFKLKLFHKWATKVGLTDKVLRQAISEIEQGLIEANLGGHVYKKRVALPQQGKRGGARVLIAFKIEDKAFFIYGFAKNKQDNISTQELKALKRLAQELIGYDNKKLATALQTGQLIEV